MLCSASHLAQGFFLQERFSFVIYSKIQKTYCTVLCSWPDAIEVHINDDLKDQIKKARNILKYNAFIRSVSLDVPEDFVNPDDRGTLYDACPYGVQRIVIFDVYAKYALQSKYSEMITAKYDFTHLIPHPVIKELQEEEEAFQKHLNETDEH